MASNLIRSLTLVTTVDRSADLKTLIDTLPPAFRGRD